LSSIYLVEKVDEIAEVDLVVVLLRRNFYHSYTGISEAGLTLELFVGDLLVQKLKDLLEVCSVNKSFPKATSNDAVWAYLLMSNMENASTR